ncbi:hypothetical protein L1080_004320 [Rhodococcus sp. MSC1_016]|jgi:hypothetical protein|uniref:hypothetical protein n=1 Tax=Rhodococcus sp. MSC1_016 TaxID=2909266 RepID=UPI00202F648B|nr:hypothetical protein [Rhodococcus sp. MSC1_016]
MSFADSKYNPLNYSASQIAKALVSLVTTAIILCGLAAGAFVDGPLAAVGLWAAAGAAALTPIAVFLKGATPVLERWENGDVGDHEADA